MLFNGTWSLWGHLVSCMTIHFSKLANHVCYIGSRHWKWAVNLVIADGNLNLLQGLDLVWMWLLTYSFYHSLGWTKGLTALGLSKDIWRHEHHSSRGLHITNYILEVDLVGNCLCRAYQLKWVLIWPDFLKSFLTFFFWSSQDSNPLYI